MAGTSGQHLGVWVNTLLTCLSSHTCHLSTKFHSKFVCILIQIKIRTFGDITSATETTSVLLQTQRQQVFCCYVQIAHVTEILFFKSSKKCSLQKITRPKLLLFQPGGFAGRIEREVGSVVCGPSQRHTTKLFIPRSHYTRATTNCPRPSTASSSQGQ